MRIVNALRGSAYALCLISGVAYADVAPLTALSDVRPGQWQLREIGAPLASAQSLCVPNAYALMQLRHAGASCTRLVINNGKEDATVQYSCPHAGWGRTSIHVETSELVRIDTQGIADNAPFEAAIEGRRTGECSGNKIGAR
ncbi:DUF3617 domain-containing protein [Flavisphingomonas formosensis]|uniref:DUF3617 domain-containing protein n=1 Tax=Flavisphingomonas formosensis TaxID=861534 RepID=UPI0012F9B1E2|nr:hypothetical protein [Sphingomonas formosensis]